MGKQKKDNRPSIYLSDIVTHVANQSGDSKASVENHLRMAFEFMGDKIATEHVVYVTNFVNFESRDYGAKDVKHPQTGNPMVIEPYRTVLSSPTAELKRKCEKSFKEKK